MVKAFNTASVKVMLNPQFGEHRATMFYCGDDAAAKLTVPNSSSKSASSP